jgi:hypothetical protein
MTTELEKQLLKMKAMGVTIATTSNDPDSPMGVLAAEAKRLGVSHEAEVLHFAPWGSPVTSCGRPVPRDLSAITDRRAATTCTDCRSRFREDQR